LSLWDLRSRRRRHAAPRWPPTELGVPAGFELDRSRLGDQL